MIEKYLKEETKEEIIEGKSEQVTSFKEVSKEEATYIHQCGHDSNPPKPCRIIKIKK